MASSSSLNFKLIFYVGLVLGLLLVQQAPWAEAVIGCNTVYSSLSPCLGYISGGPLSPGCCPGIKGLYQQAYTKPDRQAICGCLKSLAASYSSRIGKAKEILNLCKVKLPYQLSPNIDCSKVN
ncbi:OLC1v1013389C1 [Oldenlandia corymbosa var. corymbosa]|uniref:Non-specific lipid-transfer protein n=1 Tax=Oldenlandia corymbosa var. corymbosa TaxID=529605 RepID=A0AAV1DYG0_OLDCO|nr:OLC1v1013389C1 [Oldenlandia corymbosa var. corymbosa]